MPSPPEAAGAGRRPNILLIMSDQHRADLMTCAGRDPVPTPSLDRIAARGVRFEHAYCPYPVCVASRMAMLTGLYAHTTGAIDNEDRLDWRYRTMAHHLADHGYLTALIGKMHFLDAHNHGFDYYLSINDWLSYLGPKARHYADEIANHPLSANFFRTVHDHGAGLPDVVDLWDGPNFWVGEVQRYPLDTMASKLDAEDHLDSFIARESVKLMRRYREQPFFLVASFMKPHTPFFPPREWAERYPIDETPLPEIGDTSTYPPHIQRRIEGFRRQPERARRCHRAGYLGNLAFVDTCIGQVLDGLDELGLADDTIVVYASDHGEMDGDHGLFQKFCLFEPAVRVPLIVCHRGHIPEGRVTAALTELIGLYPTLCDLARIPRPEATARVRLPGAPEQLDARSFADVCRDPSAAGPAAAFSEYALRTSLPQYMVRGPRHKLVYNHGSTHELYDLEADPGETVNRIGDTSLAPVRDDLLDQLFAWYDPATNPFRPANGD